MFYSVRIYASLHSVPIYDIRTISIYTPCKLPRYSPCIHWTSSTYSCTNTAHVGLLLLEPPGHRGECVVIPAHTYIYIYLYNIYIYTIKYVEIRSTLNIYHQVFHHAIGGNSWKFIRYRISAVREMGWRCQWLVQWSPAWTAWNFSHVIIPKITNKIGLYEPSPNGRCMMVYCWFAHKRENMET